MTERLTILGSGVGVPDLEPKGAIRYPPSYLLQKGGVEVLLDCGPGTEFRLAQLGHDYSTIPTIAITHFHPDHFGGLVNFVFFSRVKKAFKEQLPSIIKLIGPVTLRKRFQQIVSAHWEPSIDPFQGLAIEFVEIGGNKDSDSLTGQAELRGYPVFHESQDTITLAYRIQFKNGFVFSYSGDSGACDGLLMAAKNADVFLCEASSNIGESKSGYGHLNPYEAGQLAAKSQVKTLLLTHYWGKDPEDKVIPEIRRGGFGGKVELVKDFQKISLV